MAIQGPGMSSSSSPSGSSFVMISTVATLPYLCGYSKWMMTHLNCWKNLWAGMKNKQIEQHCTPQATSMREGGGKVGQSGECCKHLNEWANRDIYKVTFSGCLFSIFRVSNKMLTCANFFYLEAKLNVAVVRQAHIQYPYMFCLSKTKKRSAWRVCLTLSFSCHSEQHLCSL